MDPNLAFALASRRILEAAGTRRDPKGLRGALPALRSLAKDDLGRARCKEAFAACFALDISPATGRHVRAAAKDAGLPSAGGRVPTASELADHLQGLALWDCAHPESAWALESLRLDAEAIAGAPLSPHGIAKGLLPKPSCVPRDYPTSAGFPARHEARSPLAALLFCALDYACRPGKPDWWGWTPQRHAKLPGLAVELLLAWESPSISELGLAMDAARACSVTASRHLAEFGAEVEASQHMPPLAALAGTMCQRLSSAGADPSWMLWEHGIGWDAGAVRHPTRGSDDSSTLPALPEFLVAFEREALAASSNRPLAAPRKAPSL